MIGPRLLPRLVLVALVALVAGCDGDATETADAGVEPRDDAAVEPAPDAIPDPAPDPEPDAAPDAAPHPDAAPGPREWRCLHPMGDPAPPALAELGCRGDFDLLASAPLDSTLPGARAVKTIVDRVDFDALHFINAERYPIHYDYAADRLSGEGLPVVPMLARFNSTEYTSPTRRFLLGTVLHYEGPDVYAYEIAPYDQADASMIEAAFRRIAESAWFGDRLAFHPTSLSVQAAAAGLPDDVPIVTTDELFEGIDYQPLNIAESYGQLRFVTAAELEEGAYVGFRDIVVLDQVPNDISVVMGIITEAFQTPLSHVNVLSKNRGTPNMALRGAFDDEALRALEGQWIRLRVGPLDYTVEAVDQAVADAWWDENRPEAVQVPNIDLDVIDLRDIGEVVDLESEELFDAIKTGTRAFGGKAAHYGALSHVPGVPVPRAFAIPVRHYFDFMATHGFDAEVEAMLADPDFGGDPATRDARLADLRARMEAAPLDPAFEATLIRKLRTDFPGTRMRFRSSTNAEDLDGFTGAGLYTSKSGDPDDPDDPVDAAVKRVWASVWSFRAFEERSFRGIEHGAVGMAVLVHRSFPDEQANGVALTANPFDQSGLEPAFYVNAQVGEVSVVQPPPGVTTETFLYYFDRPDQPISYISRSNLVPRGDAVLSPARAFELGQALDAIHRFFSPAYTPGPDDDYTWWAMDVEFKFDGPWGDVPELWVKQARPYR